MIDRHSTKDGPQTSTLDVRLTTFHLTNNRFLQDVNTLLLLKTNSTSQCQLAAVASKHICTFRSASVG